MTTAPKGLSAERIEVWRSRSRATEQFYQDSEGEADALCDLALRSLSAQPGVQEAVREAIITALVRSKSDEGLYAPCIFCQYNGPNYWQSGTHSKGCPFHSIGGGVERLAWLRARSTQGGE